MGDGDSTRQHRPWLANARARADEEPGGRERLRLCDLLVRLGHASAREGAALASPVRRRGDPGIQGEQRQKRSYLVNGPGVSRDAFGPFGYLIQAGRVTVTSMPCTQL